MKWCCTGFEAAYKAAGKRGLAILIEQGSKGAQVFLQMRVVDRGDEAKLSPDAVRGAALTLAEDTPISYCPWCGKRFAYYDRYMSELVRPGLKLGR